jgi:hypothetical protein
MFLTNGPKRPGSRGLKTPFSTASKTRTSRGWLASTWLGW